MKNRSVLTWLICLTGLLITLHADSAQNPQPPNIRYGIQTLSEGISDFQKKSSDENLTARGLPAEVPQTAETGTWKIPIPEVNPLGAEKLYNLGNHYKNSGELKLLLYENDSEVHQNLHGELWSLSFGAKKGDVLPFLKEYAKKMNATLLPSAANDGFVFKILKQDSLWWCDVNAKKGNRIDLNILKQPTIGINKEIKITKNMFTSDGKFYFLMEVPAGKFKILQCRLSNGGIAIYANRDAFTSQTTTLIRYLKYLNSSEYKQFTLYDFPQDPGLYEFRIDKLAAGLPDEISFMLSETPYDLPPYKSGGTGMLIVKNVPPGKIFVTPQKFVVLMYPGYAYEGGNLRGCGAACGNTVSYTLPAGYYAVVNTLNNQFLEAKTHLIPVSAGEQTIVTLPESLGIANRTYLVQADDRELTGEITIHDKKDLRETAEIALSVSDPRERDVFPSKENTVITESGVKVEILDIRREIAPSSIALVIDSSGSMVADMKATLEAVKTFLHTLPESSFIELIDFDSDVRVMKGTTLKETLANLSLLKASGSTQLYDAAIKGVDLVRGKTRPAVVLFTDGVDSREDKQGRGSIHSKEEALNKITEAKVPVYTIGFGKRLNADQTLTRVDGAPDIQCLSEFAAASGGQYYPATAPEALSSVFTAIGSKLGNNFIIRYKRPVENNIGSTPLVSMVIDNSGSMNTDPQKAKDSDFRMEKTKLLLYDFVGKLPEESVCQFTTFQGGGP